MNHRTTYLPNLGFDDATESSSRTLNSNNEDGFMNDDAKLEYKTRFLNMNSDNKWKLPSNNYVEDILYQYVKDLPYEINCIVS